MPDTPSRSSTANLSDRAAASHHGPGDSFTSEPQASLAKVIPRRAGVSWWLGIVFALVFAAVVTPAVTAERWPLRFHAGTVTAKQVAPFTVRAPMLAGYDNLRVNGGVVIARGETANRDEAAIADAIAAAMPRGPVLYLAFFALIFVLAALFTHHMRRSTKGRLVRVQIVSLAAIAVLAVIVKLVMLATAVSALVVPVAVLAMVPTMALDRIVGLATGVLAALVISLLAPFDVGLAILLLVQATTAGLVIAERPKRRWLAALTAGLTATLCTGATYLLLTYLTTGQPPALRDPLHSAWIAAAIGPALAAVLAVPLLPLYQLFVGEITQGKLFALEDLGHPLLRQIAERAPGTWQHSLMMANMAEIAANAIGASGRLVRVGAYYHDLGKSLQPKYFIENLEAGETSPHDQLPPEVSCDAIFAHVTEGIVTARKARLHERIVDFMHMHHGNGVLEYFWAKCREQGNPNDLTIERFRYPGHPPQSRETAILAICDAVEAASRTLKKPDAASIDSLVQRIVYGKLHLGQLDDSGLSMSDLRRISDSLRETIRHANHGRIEYPWQKAGQDASASVMSSPSSTAPRLDSLDRRPARDTSAPLRPPTAGGARDVRPRRAARGSGDEVDDALAATADLADSGPAGQAAVGHEAPASPEPGEVARIRAGTARNAHPGGPDPGAAGHEAPRASSEVVTILPRQGASDARREPVDRRLDPHRDPHLEPHRDPHLDPQLDPRRTSHRDPVLDRRRAGEVREAVSARDAGRAGRSTQRGAAPANRPHTEHPAPDPSRDDVGAHTRRWATAVGTSPTMRDPDASRGDPVGPDRRRSVGEAARASIDPTGPRPDGKAVATPHDPASPIREAATTARGRAPGPLPPPPDLITPETFGSEPLPAASKRAATSPPVQVHRAPAAPRPRDPAGEPPASGTSVGLFPHGDSIPRRAGDPAAPPDDPDSAITHPPPLRPGTGGQPPAPTDPAEIAAALAAIVSRVAAAPFGMLAPLVPNSATPTPRSASPAADRDQRDDAASDPPRPESTMRPAATDSTDSATTQPLLPASSPADPHLLDDAVPSRVVAERPAAGADEDAGVTEPSLPVLAIGQPRRVDLPVAAPSPPTERGAEGSSALAARADGAHDADEWGHETPIVPPSKAALRALLGHPDPTRQQAAAEIEVLQRRAAELGDSDPRRRSPNPTAEVDPDDIEAAIELAPPARRATTKNALGLHKPKKSE